MKRNTRINLLLVLVVVALAVPPLALGLGEGKEEPFAGADAQAETAITEIAPDYEPWFSPLYEPPSGEIESALLRPAGGHRRGCAGVLLRGAPGPPPGRGAVPRCAAPAAQDTAAE